MTVRLFVLGLLTGTFAVAGCNSGSAPTKSVVKARVAPEEELADTVAETLQRSNDQQACRRLVDQLNVALSRPGSKWTADALTPEQRKTLAEQFGLTAAEVEEVARREFTPLDSYALEEAFLFRDLAKALDASGLPPVERAKAALEWVVRNVRGIEIPGPAAPPAFVVMRGAGTPLERTYVLLALLRQLDFDAALVGDASGNPGGIWGVVVRTDDGLHVLDPRLGLPLTAGAGKPATLSQLRRDPGILQSMPTSGALKYDVTPERVRDSAVFVSVPLTSLAPRMRLLQGVLPHGSALVSADVDGLLERIRKSATSDGESPTVRFWASSAVDAEPRVLMTFLPAQDGGADRSEPGQGRRDAYFRDLVPWNALPPFLLQLAGEPGARIQRTFAMRILTFRQPGQARDLLIRGQFQEATEKIIELQAELERVTIPDRELEENSRGWADLARGAYADLLRAERAAKTDPAAAAEVAESRVRVENIWKQSAWPKLYMERLATPYLNEEATYLLALLKHEAAARSAGRTGAGPDGAGWNSARKWWTQYLVQFPSAGASGAARRNLALALTGEGDRAAAAAEFQAAAQSPLLIPLERLACLIRARQLQ